MDQILAVFIIVYYLYTPHLPDFLNPLSLFPSFPLSLFPSFPLSRGEKRTKFYRVN